MKYFRKTGGSSSGFSLIELMVAMSILSVLMLMLTVLLDQIQKSWRFSESRIGQFREARVAFDLMAKNISQSSLNTYWDLVVGDEGDVERYAATSELHFVVLNDAEAQLPKSSTQQPLGHAVFFQAPLGFSPTYRNLNNLFNGRGYFVSWGSDRRFKPSFVTSEDRYRFRLMEFRPPAESNQVFEDGKEERERGEDQDFSEWYKQALSVGEGGFEDHLNPLAENIIAIIISPRDSLEDASASREDTFSKIAPNFDYDSNKASLTGDADDEFSTFAHQVPPLMRVTMIAVDEASAVRFSEGSSIPAEFSEALSGAFKLSEKFNEDVEMVSSKLSGSGINFKVFSTLVMLRSSKWSGR